MPQLQGDTRGVTVPDRVPPGSAARTLPVLGTSPRLTVGARRMPDAEGRWRGHATGSHKGVTARPGFPAVEPGRDARTKL